MSFSGRLSRTLRSGVPLLLAILLLPSVVFVIALFREREWSNSTKGKIAGSIALGREQEAGPVHLAQPGLIESHAFTNVLIALTVVLGVLSGILLTHG